LLQQGYKLNRRAPDMAVSSKICLDNVSHFACIFHHLQVNFYRTPPEGRKSPMSYLIKSPLFSGKRQYPKNEEGYSLFCDMVFTRFQTRLTTVENRPAPLRKSLYNPILL